MTELKLALTGDMGLHVGETIECRDELPAAEGSGDVVSESGVFVVEVIDGSNGVSRLELISNCLIYSPTVVPMVCLNARQR